MIQDNWFEDEEDEVVNNEFATLLAQQDTVVSKDNTLEIGSIVDGKNIKGSFQTNEGDKLTNTSPDFIYSKAYIESKTSCSTKKAEQYDLINTCLAKLQKGKIFEGRVKRIEPKKIYIDLFGYDTISLPFVGAEVGETYMFYITKVKEYFVSVIPVSKIPVLTWKLNANNQMEIRSNNVPLWFADRMLYYKIKEQLTEDSGSCYHFEDILMSEFVCEPKPLNINYYDIIREPLGQGEINSKNPNFKVEDGQRVYVKYTNEPYYRNLTKFQQKGFEEIKTMR